MCLEWNPSSHQIHFQNTSLQSVMSQIMSRNLGKRSPWENLTKSEITDPKLYYYRTMALPLYTNKTNIITFHQDVLCFCEQVEGVGIPALEAGA